jgi:hypothetical protein
MNPSRVMTPDHPQWGEFVDALAQSARCHQTTEHAQAVLESMRDIDVGRSLMALRELGGTCDCAILFDLREPSTTTS